MWKLAYGIRFQRTTLNSKNRECLKKIYADLGICDIALHSNNIFDHRSWNKQTTLLVKIINCNPMIVTKQLSTSVESEKHISKAIIEHTVCFKIFQKNSKF